MASTAAPSSRKRVRSTSQAEEANISAFVDSCTNFAPSVSFHSVLELLLPTTAAAPMSSQVLVMGTAAELAEGMLALKPLIGSGDPSSAAAVEAAVRDAPAGGVFGVSTILGGRSVRLTVGRVPSEASRHNCPIRPDVMSSLVAAAIRDGGSAVTCLDVIVASKGDQRCIAAAIARGAPRSFSAKGRLGHDKAYLDNSVTVRVFFGELQEPASSLSIVAKYVQLCMRLVDAPTNLLDTVTFREIAEVYAEKFGCGLKTIVGEELREGGYGGIYGVGKGAEYPPALVTLTYQPPKHLGGITPQKKIAMVGKGLVYDTGGLAIKNPATMMCNMKTDMGGAAAVFCGFLANVELAVPHQLSVTLCLADNAIGPRSFRNDDILLLKSGLSIEVNNTDAEGRLVLSDGVFHAAHELDDFVPEILVDMATLTGAQSIATGKKHAAIYVSDEAAEKAVLAAGLRSGDTCFPVLFCPEYHNPEFASKIADFKNLMGQTNNAGISCAGQFIANNLRGFKGTFVHVDLAGPSSDANGATGFGVALAVEYVRSLTN